MTDDTEKKLEEWKQKFIDCFSPSTETRAHLELAYRDLKGLLGITPPPAEPTSESHTN